MDCQPRAKKGQPPHSTTGVASANWSQTEARGDRSWPSGCSQTCSAMVSRSSGSDSTTPTQNRRVMSRSSGLTASAPVGVIGSKAMPQIGQEPGSVRMICGCMGQVHSTSPVAGSSSAPTAGCSAAA